MSDAEAVAETPIENTEVTQEVLQEAPQETTETPPETTEPIKEPALTEGQQKTFNDAIGNKVKLYRDEQRKNQELQNQLTDLQDKIPVAARPDVPPMPDQYADDFADKMKVRDTALVAQGDFDRNERIASETNLANQQTHARKQSEAIQTAKNTYDTRGDSLGIKSEDIAPAWSALVNNGVNVYVQAHLLDQPTGPQIVDYLAKNPMEMEKLATMSPMNAAIFIDSELKGSAAGAAKKIQLAPAPVETLRGNGAREGSRGPKGATFE